MTGPVSHAEKVTAENDETECGDKSNRDLDSRLKPSKVMSQKRGPKVMERAMVLLEPIAIRRHFSSHMNFAAETARQWLLSC